MRPLLLLGLLFLAVACSQPAEFERDHPKDPLSEGYVPPPATSLVMDALPGTRVRLTWRQASILVTGNLIRKNPDGSIDVLHTGLATDGIREVDLSDYPFAPYRFGFYSEANGIRSDTIWTKVIIKVLSNQLVVVNRVDFQPHPTWNITNKTCCFINLGHKPDTLEFRFPIDSVLVERDAGDGTLIPLGNRRIPFQLVDSSFSGPSARYQLNGIEGGRTVGPPFGIGVSTLRQVDGYFWKHYPTIQHSQQTYSSNQYQIWHYDETGTSHRIMFGQFPNLGRDSVLMFRSDGVRVGGFPLPNGTFPPKPDNLFPVLHIQANPDMSRFLLSDGVRTVAFADRNGIRSVVMPMSGSYHITSIAMNRSGDRAYAHLMRDGAPSQLISMENDGATVREIGNVGATILWFQVDEERNRIQTAEHAITPNGHRVRLVNWQLEPLQELDSQSIYATLAAVQPTPEHIIYFFLGWSGQSSTFDTVVIRYAADGTFLHIDLMEGVQLYPSADPQTTVMPVTYLGTIQRYVFETYRNQIPIDGVEVKDAPINRMSEGLVVSPRSYTGGPYTFFRSDGIYQVGYRYVY